MHARVVRQLGVERGDEKAPLAQQYRDAVVARKHLDLGPGRRHPRRADEDAAQRLVLPLELEGVGLEARNRP